MGNVTGRLVAVPAWVTPTRRAMRWKPLILVASGVAGALAVLWMSSAPPVAPQLLELAVALIVAAAALALDDPAHALVAATPFGPMRRACHRLAWIVPMAGGGLWACGWMASRAGSVPAPTHLLSAAAALGAVGLAVDAVVTRWRPDLAAPAAAATPAAWVVFAISTPADGLLGATADAWLEHPLMVTVSALTAAFVAFRRY